MGSAAAGEDPKEAAARGGLAVAAAASRQPAQHWANTWEDLENWNS